MALKLDDLLSKKREPVQILDLSKSFVDNYEELKKMMEKVPEYKIKMDKIRPEEVRTFVEKKTLFRKRSVHLEKTKVNQGKVFAFTNPVPYDMRSLRLEDLCSVNIQWKMLTSLRPKVKSDEDYFSKLVELGKLQLHARQLEQIKSFTWYIRKSKNKAGITEVKIISCRECGEDFCLNEICQMFMYDSYERYVTINEKQLTLQQQNTTNIKNCKNIKKTKQAGDGAELQLKKNKSKLKSLSRFDFTSSRARTKAKSRNQNMPKAVKVISASTATIIKTGKIKKKTIPEDKADKKKKL